MLGGCVEHTHCVTCDRKIPAVGKPHSPNPNPNPSAVKSAYEPREKYYVFTRNEYSTQHIWLAPEQSAGKCISVRERYSRVQLGSEREGAGDSRIRLDAHRLVLCLTKGAPPKPTAVAKHAGGCRDPGCINPAHLAWGTQKENVREGYIDLRSRRVRQKGVVAPLVLCGVEPGRRRSFSGHFMHAGASAGAPRAPWQPAGPLRPSAGLATSFPGRRPPQWLPCEHILDPGPCRERL